MSLTACPDCASPLTGAPACPTCGLRLTGPDAVRLHDVDLRLRSLAGEQSALLAERTRLLDRLRPAAANGTVDPTSAAQDGSNGSVGGAREASPQSVQNTLLGLGALLLALAGVVFTAVTYQRLGVVGRAAVLLTLTAAACAAPVLLLRRGLTASAEAVGGVAVVLAALDAFALRKAGLLDQVDPSSWAAGAAVVLTAVGAAWSSVVPPRSGRLATCLAAQLPVLLVLDRVEPSATQAAVALAALAAADLLVADRAGLPTDCRAALAGFGTLLTLVTLMVSAAGAQAGEPAVGVGFLLVAALASAAAVRRPELRDVLLATVVPLLATAAWVTVRADLPDANEPLVGSAVVLLALPVIALLPGALRIGAVLGTVAVAGATVLTVGESVATAVIGPFTWLLDPWTLTGDRARDALLEPWTGTAATPVVLAAAAAATVGGALLVDRLRDALVPAGLLLVVTALVLPLGLDASYPVALGLLLAIASASAVTGLLARRELHLVAAAVAGLAVVWSLADETATLVVLPLVTVAVLVVALREAAATSVVALLFGATLCAYGASGGLRTEQVGVLLLGVPAACVALSYVLRREHLEGAAAVLGLTAVVLTATDDVLLTWSLALTGLIALAVAVRPDRRPVGLAGGLLLSASSWVRLAAADVHAPEPYVVPLAVTALVLGWLRRRSAGCSSYEAYGAGLSLALVPSLLRSFGDVTATRGLLLLVVCVGVVLLGVQERLQAPLVIGGGVLVADGLHLLAPYASALPRWSLLATAGALLVVVGATYEQRLRDVSRMRERFDSWA